MAAHLAVALLLIGGITLVSRWISRVGDPMFFDVVPVRYLFDLMDATVVAVFGWYGVRDTRDAFREEG